MNNQSPRFNNSTGFIYFDTSNNTKATGDNLDFIEFSETRNSFNPTQSSTPQQHQRWNNNTYPNASNRFRNRYSNQYNPYKNRNNKHNQQPNVNKDDISQYYHPSMMQDPWKKLQEGLECSDSQNDMSNSQSESYCETDSQSQESSQVSMEDSS